MSKKTATLAQLLESARRSEALTMQVAKAAQTALSGKASNPNLLDNWYFADPINQRGQTEYGVAGCAIDRFYFYGVTVSLLSDYITVSVSSESNPYSNFVQKLEYDGNFENNTTVCFSVLCRPENPFSIAIYNLTKNQWLAGNTFQPTGGADGWAVFSAYCNIGADIFDSNDLLGLNIYPSNIGEQASGSVDIKAVKLEIGPVQTLAHQDVDGNWVLNDPPPNKALELLKCQRDQMVYKNQDCVGIAIGNTILIQKPCMRANPTVLQNGATLDIASYTVGLNELTLQSVTANNAFIVAKVQNMNFDCTPVFVKYDSPAPLILDANL